MKKEKFDFKITEEGVNIKFRLKHENKSVIGYMEQAATILSNITKAYRSALIEGGVEESDANALVLAMVKTTGKMLEMELLENNEEPEEVEEDISQLFRLFSLMAEK